MDFESQMVKSVKVKDKTKSPIEKLKELHTLKDNIQF